MTTEITLRSALQRLYDETADYIHINNLGDVHHNQAMKDARDALAIPAAQPAPGWISVNERLPEGGGSVLFFTNEKVIEFGNLYDGFWVCERTAPQDEPIRFALEDERVTHWQPLPAPPELAQEPKK